MSFAFVFLALRAAEHLQKHHQSYPDDHPYDSPRNMRPGGRYHSLVVPWPHLYQRPDGESYQHQQCRPLIAGKQPVQEFGESENANETACGEHHKNRPVQVADSLHDEVILPEDHENEASGDARKNHRADRNRSADGYEPEVVGGLSRRKGADDNAENDSQDKAHDILRFVTLDVGKHEDGGHDDQAEEEGPGLDRIVFQDIHRKLREREYADGKTDAEPEQKGSVNIFPELLELAFEKELPGIEGQDRVEGVDQFREYAGEKSDRAS